MTNSTITDFKKDLETTALADKRPTYITYNYGSGKIVASANPLELFYVLPGCLDQEYWKLIFKRSLEYSLGLPLSDVPLM